MKEIVINNQNLKEYEINDLMVKVRAIIVNDSNEIIIARVYDNYSFPGGKVDKYEKPIDALKREILEETGININCYNENPFLLITNYKKNYKKKTKKMIVNKKVVTFYYIINGNFSINMANLNLSDNEKNNGFEIFLVDIDNLNNLFDKNENNNELFINNHQELFIVINEYKTRLSSSK